MRNLQKFISQLSARQKLALGAMVVLVLVTWLAACWVLASFLPL